jgi:hypothetical protein
MILQDLISTNLSLFITIILYIQYDRDVQLVNLRSLADTYFKDKETKGIIVFFILYTIWFVGLRFFIKLVGGV